MGTNCVLAYSWQYTLQPANIAYIVENGWQVMTEVYVESTLAPSQYSQYTLFIDTCEANGIPYWLDIEESMNQGEEGTNWYNILFPDGQPLFPTHLTDTYSVIADYFETYFKGGLDYYTNYVHDNYPNSTLFKGWIWEGGPCYAPYWMYNNYTKNTPQEIAYFASTPFLYMVDGAPDIVAPLYGCVDGVLDSYTYYLDCVETTVFEMYDARYVPASRYYTGIAPSIQWLRANGYKAGFICMEAPGFWGTPVLSEQYRATEAWGNYVKSLAGPVDVAMPMADAGCCSCPPMYPVAGLETVIERLTRWDSYNFTEPGTKGSQGMSQQGITPYYGTASYCTHDPPLVDTFVNTGNEVIMLKNAGSGSTTHTITVSGTTPNGLTKTQNYTLTLSPNQGTPIGPYPVDLFGFNPTITYDTTNVYVSIVGEK